MKHISLFSGIGGFDIAAEWMGWQNVAHCEWNPFCQKILKYYWPNAESFTDITKSDFTKYYGTIDIISGGFPCQPFSIAGERKGTEDDRYLWPEMLRAIREISPRWVVGENVIGLVNWSEGLVFEQVYADLEAEGYEVQAFVLPACGVDAPHKRDRVWFVAHRHGRNGVERKEESEIGELGDACSGNNERVWTDNGKDRVTSDATSERRKEREQYYRFKNSKENSSRLDDRPERPCDLRTTTTTNNNKGLQGCQNEGGFRKSGQEREKQPSGFFRPEWENFPTQSPICSRNDGIPTGLDGITFPKWRNESIKAAGNAIVPQVALQIFKSIQSHQWGDYVLKKMNENL